jgi:hypothetical protein
MTIPFSGVVFDEFGIIVQKVGLVLVAWNEAGADRVLFK